MAKKKNLNWSRVGLMGMQADRYRVGKFQLGTIIEYHLWHDFTSLGLFPSFQKAQEAAQRHLGGKHD